MTTAVSTIRGRTKGQVEDELSKSILQFEKEYIGRGPQLIRTHIVDDLIIVRLHESLTIAEQKLIESADGADLVRQMRKKLTDEARPLLSQIVQQVTDRKVLSFVRNVDIERAERILLFTLDGNLGQYLAKS